MIHIVGAGPGAVDLITVRGQRLLSEADVVIYAGSLVSRELLDWARQDARIYDSATMEIPASTVPYGNRWTVWTPGG